MTSRRSPRGVRYTRDLSRGRVPVHYGVSGLRAVGGERIESVEFQRSGLWRRRHVSIATETLLVSFGVIPHTDLSRAAQREFDAKPGLNRQ